MGNHQAKQYMNYRSPRRRQEKGAKSLFKEILDKTSQIGGRTWTYKYKKINNLQMGKTHRDLDGDTL